MQNRYVGDVGDFAKYALLRTLAGAPSERPIRLGIVWCLFPNENHNRDGEHISYLSRPDFAELDIDLITSLQKIVEGGQRQISAISSGGILPVGTIFFDALACAPNAAQLKPKDRVHYRSKWLKDCLSVTQACELVFFDPDNGLEVGSAPKHHRKAGKYIYWDELAPFWKKGHALLIYHHLNRTKAGAQQVAEMMARMLANFAGASVTSLVFRRGSCRVFWLVYRSSVLGQEIECRVNQFLSSGWARHFRSFE